MKKLPNNWFTSKRNHKINNQKMTNRKKLLLVVAILLFATSAFSQTELGYHRNQLNIGVGLSERGVPFYIGIDHGFGQDLTIGAEFSYRSYNENISGDHYDHSIMGFSGNLNYHLNRILNISNQWDFYVGPNLGFYSYSSPSNYPGNYNSEFGLGAQIGGRYHLSNNMSPNLEFGGGNAFSGGKLGLTFKL